MPFEIRPQDNNRQGRTSGGQSWESKMENRVLVKIRVLMVIGALSAIENYLTFTSNEKGRFAGFSTEQ